MRRALAIAALLAVLVTAFMPVAQGAPRPVLAYVSGYDSPDLDIRIRYSDGTETRLDPQAVQTPAAAYYHIASWFSISPDGKQIAFVGWNDACLWPAQRCQWSEGAIYTVNVDGTGLAPIYYPPADFWVANPEWSPDGKRIMFVAYYNRDDDGKKRNSDLWVLDSSPSGTWTASPLVTRRGHEKWPEWSPDGKSVIYEYGPDEDGFVQKGEASPTAIGISSVDGSSHKNLTKADAFVTDPAFSPDGRSIAYAHYKAAWASDGNVIKVMRADGSEKHTIARGLHYPWALDFSADGRFIAFGEGWKWTHTRIMRVAVDAPNRMKVIVDNPEEADHLPEYFPAP